jgi:hypothetical protein
MLVAMLVIWHATYSSFHVSAGDHDQERERCEEIIAAKEQAARLQASNSELRRRVDELLDEAQRAAATQLTHAPQQLATSLSQPLPQPPAEGPLPEGRTFDWHLAEIARLEREASIQ